MMAKLILIIAIIVNVLCPAQPALSQIEMPLKKEEGLKVPPDSSTYIIGPGDVLFVHVWKEDALSQQVQVRSDGMISLPLIDEVAANGLTPLQLKERLTQRFKTIIEEPLISVMVREAKSQKVYISGQIRAQGAYTLVGDITIFQLISLAGGFTDWANQRKLLVIRNENGKETRFNVNYKKIIDGSDPTQNIVLKPGDTIYVPD